MKVCQNLSMVPKKFPTKKRRMRNKEKSPLIPSALRSASSRADPHMPANGASCGVGTGESTGFCPDLSGLPLYDVGHFCRHDKKTAVANGLCGSSYIDRFVCRDERHTLRGYTRFAPRPPRFPSVFFLSEEIRSSLSFRKRDILSSNEGLPAAGLNDRPPRSRLNPPPPPLRPCP